MKSKKHILILFLVSLFSIIPFLSTKIYYLDDIYFHILRIESAKEAILNGIFPLKISPLYLDGMGYGVGFFYSYTFILPAALFNILGLSIITSYKLYLFLCTFLSGLSMYYCINKIQKSEKLSLITSILYLLCSYKIIDTIYRGAIGEVLSFIFIPFVVFGIFNIIYNKKKEYRMLTIGLAGVYLSHNLTSAIVMLFILLICLLNVKLFIKSPIFLWSILKGVLLSLLLTAYFWVPMLEQLVSSEFKLNTSVESMAARGIELSKIFIQNSTNEYFEAPYFLGLPLLVIPIIGIILKVKFDKPIKHFMLLGYFFFFLTLKSPFLLFIEKNIPGSNQLQFPWRFNIIASILLSYVSGYVIYFLINKFNNAEARKSILVLGLVSLLVFTGYTVFKYPYFRKTVNFDSNFYQLKDNTNAIGYGEYLPKNTNKDVLLNKNKEIEFSKPTNINSTARNNNSYTFIYNVISNETSTLTLPLVYYKGYQYKIDGAYGKNQPWKNVSLGDNGRVSVSTKNIYSGRITVKYRNTPLIYISYVISFITLVASVLFQFKIHKKFSRH